MKSNFNKRKRWAPKTKLKRVLGEERPKRRKVSPDKTIDVAKILEIQNKLKENKELGPNRSYIRLEIVNEFIKEFIHMRPLIMGNRN